MVNGKGAVKEEYYYNTKGQRENKYNPFLYNNEYGLNNEAHTVEGGQYLRARYVDLKTESFISEDSYYGNVVDSSTRNHYNYLRNNPNKYEDPSGHFNLFSAVASAASKVVNTVTKVATTVAKAVTTTVKKVADVVVNTTKAVVNTVVNTAKAVVNTVKAVANTASNVAKTVVNHVTSSSSNHTTSNHTSGGGTNNNNSTPASKIVNSGEVKLLSSGSGGVSSFVESLIKPKIPSFDANKLKSLSSLYEQKIPKLSLQERIGALANKIMGSCEKDDEEEASKKKDNMDYVLEAIEGELVDTAAENVLKIGLNNTMVMIDYAKFSVATPQMPMPNINPYNNQMTFSNSTIVVSSSNWARDALEWMGKNATKVNFIIGSTVGTVIDVYNGEKVEYAIADNVITTAGTIAATSVAAATVTIIASIASVTVAVPAVVAIGGSILTGAIVSKGYEESGIKSFVHETIDGIEDFFNSVPVQTTDGTEEYMDFSHWATDY